MPTALIVGVASQDGSYLAEFLSAKKYNIVGTIRASGDDLTHISHLKNVVLEPADLLQPQSLEALIRKYQPQEVYCLAALTLPADSWDKAALVGQVTGIGPIHLMEAIRKYSPKSRFFQAGSREIFGTVSRASADENTPLHPENPYAAAKAYAHHMVQIYRSEGIFACSGIMFNHESPRRPPQFVTRKITMAAAAKAQLRLWDLASPRDRGYAKEYVEAMWLMLQNKKPQDYIIATNTLHTIADICQIAYAHVGLDYKDYVTLDPASVSRSTDSVRGDYGRIKKDLGWSPQISFKNLIELMVDSDLKNI